MANPKVSRYFLIIGLMYVLVGVLGCFSIGFIGRMITNVFRIFVGEAYVVIAITSMLYGLLLILLKKELHFKRPVVFWSFFSFLMSYVCWIQQGFASQSMDILTKLIKGLYGDIQLNQISFKSGGGLLGGVVNQLLNWLHIEFLLPFMAGGFLLLGVGLLFNKNKKRADR